MVNTTRALRFDANQRPRGQCQITLEWRGRTIAAVIHQERRYPPHRQNCHPLHGRVGHRMMAQNYFVERLWLSTDGTALWEQQPLTL